MCVRVQARLSQCRRESRHPHMAACCCIAPRRQRVVINRVATPNRHLLHSGTSKHFLFSRSSLYSWALVCLLTTVLLGGAVEILPDCRGWEGGTVICVGGSRMQYVPIRGRSLINHHPLAMRRDAATNSHMGVTAFAPALA